MKTTVLLGFLSLAFVACPAVAQVKHVTSADYLTFSGPDLPSKQRHVTLLTDPATPSTIVIVVFDPMANRVRALSPFTCLLPDTPIAYWQTATPSIIQPAVPPWPYPIATAIIPRDQAMPARLILGCRSPSPPR